MSLLDQIQNDYTNVVTTQFWKHYIAEIGKRRSAKSRMCETTDKEKLEKIQGFIEGMDFVLRLPEELMSGKLFSEKE
jgi:hypothetical protein